MTNYHLTKAQLVLEYKSLRNRLKRQPRCADFARQCYHSSTVNRVFGEGGWRKLVIAAGDTPRKLIIKNLTAKHLMNDFVNLQEALGRRPKLIEYTYQCHTPKVLDKVFGSPGWRNMLKKLGRKVMHKGIDAEHLIVEYLSLRKEMGRNPTIDQFFKRRHHSYKLLSRVFPKRPWTSFIAAVRNYEVRNNTAML